MTRASVSNVDYFFFSIALCQKIRGINVQMSKINYVDVGDITIV